MTSKAGRDGEVKLVFSCGGKILLKIRIQKHTSVYMLNVLLWKSLNSKPKLESWKAKKCLTVHGEQFLLLSVHFGKFNSKKIMSKFKIDKYTLTRVKGNERHDDRNCYFITSDLFDMKTQCEHTTSPQWAQKQQQKWTNTKKLNNLNVFLLL